MKKQAQRKTQPQLLKTISLARRQPAWRNIAGILSGPSRLYADMNLYSIDKLTSEGDTVLILGKVLSSGNITKRIRVCALGFSLAAREKLKKTKSEVVSINEEIKKNPKAEGIRILS